MRNERSGQQMATKALKDQATPSSMKEKGSTSSSKQRKTPIGTVKNEPVDAIVVSSDDEAQQPRNVVSKVVRDQREDCEWIIPVSKAIENLKRKQTLHIPSWVVKAALINRTQIYVRSAETGRTYNCTIINPKRSFQRYIANGWYDYLDDHRPKVKNILHFKLKALQNLLIVNLIR